jgi:2-oxoglutarate-dependent dioxygenase
MIELTQEQLDRFDEDGFLSLNKIIGHNDVDRIVSRFEPLFRGEFETGIAPDEVNWQEGRDSDAYTRQICNGWKADRTIARFVLGEDIGRIVGHVTGWSGVRVMIDNVLWKPPGARPLGYHQDNAYLAWFRPSEIVSCWIALDNTAADGGTVEHVRGSHKWARREPEGEFHGPEDYRKYMEVAAAAEGVEPEVVPVVVQRGGGAIHHGWTWHGSGFNSSSNPRRALVIHAMREDVEYNPGNLGQGTGNIYSRYKKINSNEIDENFFPIIWSRDGRRTPGIDEYISGVN